jgi:maltose alpha-D-glucosyltransferase/alpha-amylase
VAGTNTTMTFDDRVFLKVYRRLRAGLNPEVEIGRFLTEASRFGNIAPMAGTLELEVENGGAMTLAVLQGYVPSQGDMWAYTQGYLGRYLQNVHYQPLPEDLETPHAPYRALAEVLGRRTGDLHTALARRTGDAAFDPAPVSVDDVRTWRNRIAEDAVATLGRLGEVGSASGSASQALEAASDRLLERIQRAVPDSFEAMKTRYHGDLHLAQVLVVENDFVFIDFEGEPGRGLAERREKHSPLRDIAGMLRSFSYAASVATAPFSSEYEEIRRRMEACVSAWERVSVESFLSAYQEAAAASPGLPRDTGARRGLLELFTIEKALYELRYELDHRPDWADIPIRGLLALLGGPTPGGAEAGDPPPR